MGMVAVALFAAEAVGPPETTIQIDLETNQVRRKLRQAHSILLGKPVLDGGVFSFNPSKLVQFLPERVHEDRHTGSSAWI
jgi:hypothetical protein